MSGVQLVADPFSALRSAPVSDAGAEALEHVRDQIPPEIGLVDEFIGMFTGGYSILNEFVIKPFAGDWKTIGNSSEGWSQVGISATALQDALRALPRQVGDSWQGQTADAWKRANQKVIASHESLHSQCDSMANLCDKAIQLGESISTLVISIIVRIIERGLSMAEALSVPVIGEVVDAAEIIAFLHEVFGWARQIMDAIDDFMQFVQSIDAVESAFAIQRSGLEVLAEVLVNVKAPEIHATRVFTDVTATTLDVLDAKNTLIGGKPETGAKHRAPDFRSGFRDAKDSYEVGKTTVDVVDGKVVDDLLEEIGVGEGDQSDP